MKDDPMRSLLGAGFFDYEGWPPALSGIAEPIKALAMGMDIALEPGTEKSTFMRKLLEARDAAIRQRVLDVNAQVEREENKSRIVVPLRGET